MICDKFLCKVRYMNYNDSMMVSVICNTYNQKKYIRQCINSLICQKTNFKYEILIHDDASTDGTAEIVKECEKKNPDLIRTVIQTENQYSQGKNVSDFLYAIAKGKYFAYCEGDDFWCDEYKLQKQFDAMEKHPDCGICVHKVKMISENGNDTVGILPKRTFNAGIINRKQVIETLSEYSFQTSSYFLRGDIYLDLMSRYQSLCNLCPVGDVKMISMMASIGDFYYIDDIMSCYRTNAQGSWNERLSKNNNEKIIHAERAVEYFCAYKEYICSLYDDYDIIMDDVINGYMFRLLWHKRDFKSLVQKKYRKHFKIRLSKREQIYCVIMAYCPFVMKFYYFLKGKKEA